MKASGSEKDKTQADNQLLVFGQRVKKVRESLHLLQKDFAAELGISNSFLSDIEAGKTRASYEFFYNIAKKFKVNLYYLLLGEGEMFTRGEGEPVVDYGPDSDIIRNMLKAMRRLPTVRFAVLGFFNAFIFDKREMLKAEMEVVNKSKPGGESPLKPEDLSLK